MRIIVSVPVVAYCLSLGAVTQAQAPAFQAPFPCGQVWRASTYEGHGSNAIDLVQRASNLAIIGEFQPTVASAAGTIVFDHTWPSGSKKDERWVIVDHGDGWRTHYFHLEAEAGKPRLEVGRKVAMGEVLGRTSNSGASAVHLHYAQMRSATRDAASLNGTARANVNNWRDILNDGTKTRTRFNGRAIETYLANEDSWGHFSSDESEKIRSFNCPAGRFAHWASGGNNYMLRHNPGNGDMRLNRFSPNTGNNPLLLNRNWGDNWNLFVPFFNGSNQAHLIQYDFASGKIRFTRISPGYDGMTVLNTRTIYKGWTEMVPIRIGGRSHAISYDSRYGWFNVDRINVTSDGLESRLKTKVGTGFTHIIPFEQGPRRYVLMYRGSTGQMVLQRLREGANGTIERRRVWSGTRAAGWTHMTLLQHRGQRHLLGYNSVTGTARLWRIRPNGQGLEIGARMNWQPGWTAITPYLDGGAAHALVYRSTDGLSRKVRLRDDLSGFQSIVSENWARNYR